MNNLRPIDFSAPIQTKHYPSSVTGPERQVLVGSHPGFPYGVCEACGVSLTDAVLDKTKRRCTTEPKAHQQRKGSI